MIDRLPTLLGLPSVGLIRTRVPARDLKKNNGSLSVFCPLLSLCLWSPVVLSVSVCLLCPVPLSFVPCCPFVFGPLLSNSVSDRCPSIASSQYSTHPACSSWLPCTRMQDSGVDPRSVPREHFIPRALTRDLVADPRSVSQGVSSLPVLPWLRTRGESPQEVYLRTAQGLVVDPRSVPPEVIHCKNNDNPFMSSVRS